MFPKNTITILSGVMLSALLALLGFQWYWVQNAITLKEEQFRYRVQSAMDAVAQRLQDQEIYVAVTAQATSNGSPQRVFVQETQTNIQPGHTQTETHTRTIRLTDSTQDTTVVHASAFTWGFQETRSPILSEDHEVIQIKTDCVETQGRYALNIVRRMLKSPLPIAQRVQPRRIDSLLREELAQREIQEPIDIHLIQLPPLPVSKLPPLAADQFRVQLFPHDLPPSNDYLELRFPSRASPTRQAMSLLLPTSGVLALVVIGCFGLTLLILRRQKKLSEMKTDFINNMTHELKTPISTISLAIQALEDPDMVAAGKTSTYLNIIRSENARMQSQVERVLQAAVGQRGELTLNRQTIHLQHIINQEAERLRFPVESRGGTLHLQIPAAPLHLQADPVHLAGILRNLLENAEKYSPQSPHITLRLETDPTHAHIYITDQGIGISREERHRIFEPFYRVSTGNIHDVKGFGLGLSYVKAMVQAHGGTIDLRSEPAQGSTFHITLPLS